AVAQVSAGDQAGYRRTCQEMLRRSAASEVALPAMLAGHVPQNIGAPALVARLVAGPSPLGNLRLTTVRACLLQPDEPAVLERLLPPSWWRGSDRRGAVLCRLKRYDEAVPLLQSQQQQFPLAGLYLALAELGRGNVDQAKQLLDKAGKTAPAQWVWE